MKLACCAQTLFPERVADHDRKRRTRAIVALSPEPAERRLHAERVEEGRARPGVDDLVGLTGAADRDLVGRVRRDGLATAIRRLPRQEIRHGQ